MRLFLVLALAALLAVFACSSGNEEAQPAPETQPAAEAQAAAETPAPSANTELALKFLALLEQDKFEEATGMFDAQMKAALPADKLRQTCRQVADQMGEYQGRGESRTEQVQGMEVVHTPYQFAQGKIDAQVVIGPQGQISGFWLRPWQE